ncbi:MAG: MBL fold metallo-hydrolase [Chromatiales bacterium]|nr:MAG: MBL fold metallo-hydrolase [Chromatiales bacterium]
MASRTVSCRSRPPGHCRWAAWAAALVLGLSAAHAAPPMVPAGKTVQLTEQVYMIPDQGVPLVPNVGIIVGSAGVLVVDTGMGPANAEIVLNEVRQITDKPILYLVSTHFHPEHNFGAQSFPLSTVLIYSTAQHRDVLTKGEAYRTWFIDMFGADVQALLEPVKLVTPDVTFERRAVVNLGDLPVELLHFGYAAHTGGDTVIYLPEQKILFAGGLTPNQGFPIVPDGDSSVRGWIATLDDLAALDAATVVPGHGQLTDAQVMQRVKTYLTSVQGQARDLKAAGVALADAQDRLYTVFTQRYPDWREPDWIRNAVELSYAEADAAN